MTTPELNEAIGEAAVKQVFDAVTKVSAVLAGSL